MVKAGFRSKLTVGFLEAEITPFHLDMDIEHQIQCSKKWSVQKI